MKTVVSRSENIQRVVGGCDRGNVNWRAAGCEYFDCERSDVQALWYRIKLVGIGDEDHKRGSIGYCIVLVRADDEDGECGG